MSGFWLWMGMSAIFGLLEGGVIPAKHYSTFRRLFFEIGALLPPETIEEFVAGRSRAADRV